MLLQRLRRRWRTDCDSDLLHCLEHYPLAENVLFVDVGVRGEPIARWPKKLVKNIHFVGIDADPEAIMSVQKDYAQYVGNIKADFFVVCLADEERQVGFHCSDDGFRSSICDEANQQLTSAQTLTTITLDRFLKDKKFVECFGKSQTTAILKIDVEGYSTEVLRGCREYLSQFDIVMIESLPHKKTQYEAYQILDENGFVMVDLYRLFVPDAALERKLGLLDSVWIKQHSAMPECVSCERKFFKRLFNGLVFQCMAFCAKCLPRKLQIGVSDVDLGW